MGYGLFVRTVLFFLGLTVLVAPGCNQSAAPGDGPAPAASNIPRAAPSATGARYDLSSGPLPAPGKLPRNEGSSGGGTTM